MRIAVLGPGGVGGLLAGLLSKNGQDVVVVGREASSSVIAEDGLTIESRRFGDFHVHVRSVPTLEESVDACLITVKATQLREALHRLPVEHMGSAVVVPFLNGIDHMSTLRGIYPPDQVAAGTIRVELARIGPGVIRHTSPFASIELATVDANHLAIDLLASQLTAAGLDVRVRTDEVPMLWEKLAFLAPMALMTTIYRTNVGVIRSKHRTEILGVIHEVARVAQAERAQVNPEAVTSLLDSVPAAMELSMQRDQEAARPLELDAIGGAVLRHAALVGVPVPITSHLVAQLSADAGA